MPARFHVRLPARALPSRRQHLRAPTSLTTTSARYASHASSTSPSAAAPAAHRYEFFSVGQALQAASAAGPSGVVKGGRNNASSAAAGLTFTLPPLCIWGAASSSQDVATEGSHYVSRRSGASAASTSSRYAGVWSPLESYLDQLNRSSESSGEAAAATPAFVVLRLFPDLTIAQLPSILVDTHPEAEGALSGRSASSRRRRRPAAPHEVPLEAILSTEEPWGGGADPQLTFRHALEGLHEMGQRLLPQVPLVLQFPTRLLVSQQFLEDLATTLVRSGWRSVSFELPSTHQLYGPFQGQVLDGSQEGPKGSSGMSEGRAFGDSGAVDAAWCRLPLLCTPWAALCRHPTLGPSLRRLRRTDVVPFHVLFSWALREARLFDGLEQAVAVDVTAPLAGSARRQAVVQSPASVGVSREEAGRLAGNASAEGWETTLSSLEQQQQQQHPSRFAVYMGEDPTANLGAGVGLSAEVADVVRQHQKSGNTNNAGGNQRSSESTSHGADLGLAEAALRKARAAALPPPRSPRCAPPPADDASPLILDAPPDHLRALIEKSILSHSNSSGDQVGSSGAAATALTPRQQLLRKVGQFMQHTLSHDAAAAASEEEKGEAASLSNDDAAAAAALEREAAELEQLLRQANAAFDAADAAGADVEHMTREVQRYMKSQAEPAALQAASTDESKCSSGADAVVTESGQRVWSQCAGYWACMHSLLTHVTQAQLLWTLPTYNAAAVQSWSEAYAASESAAAKEDRQRESNSAVAAAADDLLPLIPVWMPLQPVMHAEVARLLREGRAFPQPTAHDPGTCSTWLPESLSTALQEALVQLPQAYQAEARRHLLHSQRVLRDGGAQAAGRAGCEIQGLAATAAAGSGGGVHHDHQADPHTTFSTPSLGSAEYLDHNAEDAAPEDEEDDGGDVRIRLRRSWLPMYMLTPSQVEKMEAEGRRHTAAAAADAASSTETSTQDGAKALVVAARDVDEAFVERVADYYGSAAARQQRVGRASSLYVPTPGLDASLLERSWRLVS